MALMPATGQPSIPPPPPPYRTQLDLCVKHHGDTTVVSTNTIKEQHKDLHTFKDGMSRQEPVSTCMPSPKPCMSDAMMSSELNVLRIIAASSCPSAAHSHAVERSLLDSSGCNQALLVNARAAFNLLLPPVEPASHHTRLLLPAVLEQLVRPVCCNLPAAAFERMHAFASKHLENLNIACGIGNSVSVMLIALILLAINQATAWLLEWTTHRGASSARAYAYAHAYACMHRARGRQALACRQPPTPPSSLFFAASIRSCSTSRSTRGVGLVPSRSRSLHAALLAVARPKIDLQISSCRP